MTVVALVTPQEALQLDGSNKLVAAECAVSGVSYEPVGTITGMAQGAVSTINYQCTNTINIITAAILLTQ
jgi:hypothetical protein